MRRSCNIVRRVDVGLTCVDIGQSPLTYLCSKSHSFNNPTNYEYQYTLVEFCTSAYEIKLLVFTYLLCLEGVTITLTDPN